MLKIIILCIWCNRKCWHALMFKKHIIFQTLYIIVFPLCPASLKLQSPSFRQAQSALIGQLTQSIVIGRTPQALVGNVTPLTIITSFSFSKLKTVNHVLSFTISSCSIVQQSHVTDTVMKLVCVCTQAAVVWSCLPLSHTHARTHMTLRCDPFSLSPSFTHTHTHTQCAKLRIWTVNSKYLN